MDLAHSIIAHEFINRSGRAISKAHKAMFGITILTFLLTTVHMTSVLIQAIKNKSTVGNTHISVAILNVNVSKPFPFFGRQILR
jgi:hypothetical protein